LLAPSDTPIGKHLAEVWERLLKLPEGFVCTDAAWESYKVLGGVIYGFWEEECPGELAKGCGGHDFLLIEDRFIIDFWAAAYLGHRAVYDLYELDQREEILRLYGPRRKWKKVDTSQIEKDLFDMHEDVKVARAKRAAAASHHFQKVTT